MRLEAQPTGRSPVARTTTTRVAGSRSRSARPMRRARLTATPKRSMRWPTARPVAAWASALMRRRPAASLNLGATFTSVPGGTAHWSFTGGANYNDQSGTASITIEKAGASCTISGFTGTYDATPHGATGSCSGVGTDATAVGSTLNPGASFTSVPGGTADLDVHRCQATTMTRRAPRPSINKADAVVSVSGYSGTYDAAAHGATGSCTGVDSDEPCGEQPRLRRQLHQRPRRHGELVVHAAAPTTTIRAAPWPSSSTRPTPSHDHGYSVTSTRHAHGATGTCAGVDNGSDRSAARSILGASYTNAPGGTADLVVHRRHQLQRTERHRHIAIAKANAVCHHRRLHGTYDANAHGATGSCAGIAADPAAAGSSVNLGASYTNVPGGTAHWTFTGGANYHDQTGSVAIVINKANATSARSRATPASTTACSHGATGSVMGVNNAPVDGQRPGPRDDATSTCRRDRHVDLHRRHRQLQQHRRHASPTPSTRPMRSARSTATRASTTATHTAPRAAAPASTAVGPPAGSLDLGASFTNVPGGTANWTFTAAATTTTTRAARRRSSIDKADARSASRLQRDYDAAAARRDADRQWRRCVNHARPESRRERTPTPGRQRTLDVHGHDRQLQQHQWRRSAISIAKANADHHRHGYSGDLRRAATRRDRLGATGVGGADLSAWTLSGTTQHQRRAPPTPGPSPTPPATTTTPPARSRS